jgi:hypothetical protein
MLPSLLICRFLFAILLMLYCRFHLFLAPKRRNMC